MSKKSLGNPKIRTVAISLARGKSKGIPKKNIIDFCGKPLIAWTINQCLGGGIKEIYVSSDSEEILAVAESYGAHGIKRPGKISGDLATFESGWLHALEVVESQSEKVDCKLALQVTSPIRTPSDIPHAIKIAETGQFDSIFSVLEFQAFFLWVNYPVEGLK